MARFMKNPIQLYRNYRIEISGLMAWSVFTTSAVKFVPIFLHFQWVTISTFFFCSILFLAYFFIYYRKNFTFKKFFVLNLVFSIGFLVLHYTYSNALYLYSTDIEPAFVFGVLFSNLILSLILYGAIRLFVNR